MGNSLQDQLKRSGLVDEKQARKTRQEQRRKRKRGEEPDAESDAVKAEARRAAEQKAAHDRALNRERQAEAEARAVAAQVRQLIERNRLARGEGDVAYNFTDGKAIKRIHLNAPMHAELVAGALALVRLDADYEVVPAPVARKIAERDADCVLVLNERTDGADDEGYEEFEVPDDMMW